MKVDGEGTIPQDVLKPANPYEGGPIEDDGEAAAALMKRWTDEETPSKDDADEGEQKPADETTQDDAQKTEGTEDEDAKDGEDHEETDEQTEESDEKADQEQSLAGDDLQVVIKVGEEEKRVSVKDLKRLYGQEAALTQKSQEVAVSRKKADEAAERSVAALQTMYARAKAKFEPFSKVDFFVASQNMSKEDFAQLRKDAQEAYADVQFFEQEIDKTIQTAREQAQTRMVEDAKKAVEVLKTKITDWSPQLYSDIRDYAVKSGMSAEVVNSIVDPVAIELIDKARRYDAAKAKTAVVKKKVATAPKNAVKSTKAPSGDPAERSFKQAKGRLAQTGDSDDAVAALMAKWA